MQKIRLLGGFSMFMPFELRTKITLGVLRSRNAGVAEGKFCKAKP